MFPQVHGRLMVGQGDSRITTQAALPEYAGHCYPHYLSDFKHQCAPELDPAYPAIRHGRSRPQNRCKSLSR